MESIHSTNHTNRRGALRSLSRHVPDMNSKAQCCHIVKVTNCQTPLTKQTSDALTYQPSDMKKHDQYEQAAQHHKECKNVMVFLE
jgi:hypothetical protein